MFGECLDHDLVLPTLLDDEVTGDLIEGVRSLLEDAGRRGRTLATVCSRRFAKDVRTGPLISAVHVDACLTTPDGDPHVRARPDDG